ncbi:flagellar biosynthesis anti-sigma factor FlgM [Acetanaerobacterium elongatum]|uniref:Negative regulator of flagellin synthesis FlgM n=1 Tax=Acetanaerobacterium elongatum TaxID=258515 RepID=A0A1G9ZH69_9FIRM|nr:flagellar biosynthesis anti-sigma factor FlgM [Acetanaerobacterium elongatum]SDN20669.1 negative regulator of flagellin synthesis FlgM [Acetanaerobacterium elongatum]
MVIQRFDSAQFYKNYAANSNSKGTEKVVESKGGTDRLDRLELSSNAAQAKSAFLTRSIAAEVNENTSIERLSAIKQSIADGTYRVSSSVIASALLSGGCPGIE